MSSAGDEPSFDLNISLGGGDELNEIIRRLAALERTVEQNRKDTDDKIKDAESGGSGRASGRSGRAEGSKAVGITRRMGDTSRAPNYNQPKETVMGTPVTTREEAIHPIMRRTRSMKIPESGPRGLTEGISPMASEKAKALQRKAIDKMFTGREGRHAGAFRAFIGMTDRELAKETLRKEKDKPGGMFAAYGKFERGAGALRRDSQRLKQTGLWFFETAMQNPSYTGFKIFVNKLRKVGPAGRIAAGALSFGISGYEVFKEVIRQLGQKGMPLNQDWRRSMEDEVTGFLSLGEQKRRDLGLNGVIVTQDMGYREIDGTMTYNNQLIADEVRLNKLTQEEKVSSLA